ncbi:coiled-coil domain-containing protein 42 homolog [Nematolebias whitei]|uniref:coiled-coil domain-containing protein 42 homolog n=1 Tax=Nematolebias whitei TaxID=451745 RepID=UPI00189AC101|nr:coiled-coil domain-containing protein 42 homolog [Nematolebias whitei]
MATSFLPVLESGPSSKLNVDKREDRVHSIISSSRVLQAGLKTLKKSQVDEKQAELDEVDIQLAVKRQEFKNRLEALARRKSELESKQQQDQEKMMKFEKFISENEVKSRGALKRWEAARQHNITKQGEIEDLTEQLKQLRARKLSLKEKTTKYKIYEDYLMKTLDQLPSSESKNGYESLGMPIIRRHETLSITHQELWQQLRRMEAELETGQRQLQTMEQEHSVRKLLANKELSELQSELETLKEKNQQAEADLVNMHGVSREKAKEMGKLLLAINSLAQQCYLPAYGPLETMDTLTKMDMVKEYILDKADTERRARKTMEHGLAKTSAAALNNKKETASMKSI